MQDVFIRPWKMNPAKSFIVFLFVLMVIFISARPVHANAGPFTLLTPSVTTFPTSKSSITPSATLTLIPTQTPVVITVVHIKIITVVPTTVTPSPSVTLTPIPATNTAEPTLSSPDEKETGNQSPLSIAIIGMVATFIAGIVVGSLWSRLTKR